MSTVSGCRCGERRRLPHRRARRAPLPAGRAWTLRAAPVHLGLPCGALRSDETPEEGAVREATEEFGSIPAHTVAEVIAEKPAGAGGWGYHTVIADVSSQVALPAPANAENTGQTCWVTVAEMRGLRLHPGVAALVVALSG